MRAMRMLHIYVAIALLLGLRPDQTAQTTSPSKARSNATQYLAIVVNRSNPINNLSFTELRKIFLGERNHWPNGHRIAIAMLDNGQPERETVLRLIYRLDENGYQNHLLREMPLGDSSVTRKTLASPVILRKFVFNAPGAIGYLRASDVDESVKVVRIDGLLPYNKDYRLQIDERSVE
jgi:ABC-type phosphate transport system substrate-binding protein